MSKHSRHSGQSTNTRSGEAKRGSQNNSDKRATAKDMGNQGKRQASKAKK